MSLNRILLIRHAEEHDVTGVTDEGRADRHSLTVRGWQRAGALVRFFCPEQRQPYTPDAIFTSSVAPGSESRRPCQTVAPLLAFMRARGGVAYNDAFAKPDTAALAAEVMTRSGTVLIAWEHSRIPAIVAALPDAPQTPEKWPSDRYDLVWVLDRQRGGWAFTQVPQQLLAGDGASV